MRSWIIALHVLSINLKLWNSADKDGFQTGVCLTAQIFSIARVRSGFKPERGILLHSLKNIFWAETSELLRNFRSENYKAWAKELIQLRNF